MVAQVLATVESTLWQLRHASLGIGFGHIPDPAFCTPRHNTDKMYSMYDGFVPFDHSLKGLLDVMPGGLIASLIT